MRGMQMKVRVGLLCGALGLAVLAFAIAWQPRLPGMDVAGPAEQAPQPTDGQRTPVVVELFTSEGCSSCPPADALLARLERTQPIPGAEVIALKEHVDYWNHLGWRDPFSSAELTARQNFYAKTFGNAGVYTPQMIVDGQVEFVGSSESRARRAIARAAGAPKAPVHLGWASDPGGENTAVLEVSIGKMEAATAGDTAEVFLAVTEGGLHSDVKRGENAGRQLDHFAVVRELRGIGKANPVAATAFTAQTAVKASPEWRRENLRAVVFVQERRSRRVLGAAGIPLIGR